MNTTHVIDSRTHSENSNQFEQVMRHDTQPKTMSILDNPKTDIQIDYRAMNSDKQVSASKYLHGEI